ncbi:helix-turn-helix domain-containing protein [Rhodoferax mekongensis]|uniref:helix-turn-helix domain-containing protein n=1 Tax=Rhodoferax mekongensis TaxID=3068341 RepID=UPI0028BE8B46|nr:helix-turn-helix domain-containing protein [Rhodoferax sp. TBRC 17199]MDT7514680.1 helix-turn-helix domain-containing protein [Rhodoferax sp. TBRC 17199]
MARVWECSRHGGTELLALLALADFADDEGMAFPSVGTLARKCRLQPRRMNYILASLQESGELEIRANKGRLGTNLYRIKLKSEGLHSSAGVHSGAGVHSTASPPCTPVREPLHSSADKPSLTIKEPSSSKKSVPDFFEEFYKAYPRKVSKANAIKAFRAVKVGRNELPKLLADIQRRLSCGEWVPTHEKMQFIPHPATYLNGRRWEDEVPAGDQSANKPWEGAL